ncbi:MAG: hypothetical protein HF973_07410 [Chloroflexi bacterium]|nr:hypothetical protein [Chloroflexota bacterium]
MGAILFLLLAATACGVATVEPTAVPPSTNTPSANDHVDDPNDPAHVHLDDGSTLSTEGTAPLEEGIWQLLLAGDPIVVGRRMGVWKRPYSPSPPCSESPARPVWSPTCSKRPVLLPWKPIPKTAN